MERSTTNFSGSINGNRVQMSALSLLDYQAWIVLPAVMIVYIILQLFMGLNHSTDSRICNEQHELSTTTSFFNSGAAM